MSEPVSQPGAPSETPTDPPQPSEKSIQHEAEKRMSPEVKSALSNPDRLLLRLNKLLAAPGGLSTFLSTFNYTLWFLVHVESKTIPLQERLYRLINRNAAIPKISPAVAAAPSRIAALAGLLSKTRTTLRLFGLIPMYAWARQLAAGPKPGQDQILYLTSATQCALYIAFQFLENVAVLTQEGVLPKSLTTKYAAKYNGELTGIFTASYRAWFFGFCCDFVRLAREAQLERQKRSRRSAAEIKDISTQQEDKKADQRFWLDLAVPVCWFPVGFQFAALNETGFPGWNLGLMGAAGALAGFEKFKLMWDATA